MENAAVQNFTADYSKVYRELYRLAYYFMRSHEEAEDMVSKAALAAWAAYPQLRDPSRFRPWITKILVNCCKRQLSRTPVLPYPPESVYQANNITAREILSVLPPRERAIVTLSVLGNYNSREIGQLLGINPATVRTRLSRALHTLQLNETKPLPGAQSAGKETP